RKPVNDLSRGATVADIVTTVAVTAAQVTDAPPVDTDG
ncbi:phosphate acyltransferase, partial [Nonomuraea fuscirosea]